jgi:formylglycine-generating enzyme required for sulfatase activity
MLYLYETDSGLEGGWSSVHDSFNQVLSWLLMLQPGDPFDPDGTPDGQLAINISGQGGVGFLGPAGGRVCEASCSFTVHQGDLELAIGAGPGAELEAVSDNCPYDPATESCTVSVARSTTVNVVFTGGDQAQIAVGRQGSGSIILAPGEQRCFNERCQFLFAPSTDVTLQAVPAENAIFAGWSGDCSGSQRTCELSVEGSGVQYHAGAAFSAFDCPHCPTMIQVPSGAFVQGSPFDEPGNQIRERPRHTVNVSAFLISRSEITFDQWDACVADGGCSHVPTDAGWGRGNRPVIGVSRRDIEEYLTWLSNTSGSDYRLPTESEWEYAARAGTTTRFNTGECISTDNANFTGDFPVTDCATSGPGQDQTVPVEQYSPNAFGLYDTHGNVWEVVQDCWNLNYEGAPIDGSAWLEGDCSRAVARGGGWASNGQLLRSAYRGYVEVDHRYINVGFRVVRSVSP